MSDELRSAASGYRISIKDMQEWAARGGDYYGFDLDNETLSEDIFGLSEEDAFQEFDDGHSVDRDNVIIEPIYVCSNDGKEIEGEPFRVAGSMHFFCNEDCFYEHDAAVMDKLRGKYQ
jgi:hypothetical protein